MCLSNDRFRPIADIHVLLYEQVFAGPTTEAVVATYLALDQPDANLPASTNI